MRTLIMFAALFTFTAYADEWTKRFEVTENPDVRIDGGDASVVLRPGANNAVEARLVTKGWRIGPGDVRVIDHQTGNKVEIEVRFPHGEWGFGQRSARLELTVPRELRADIHTGDGSVRAQGLAGELRLITGDGAVEADGVDGTLEARTGDGSIRARGRLERLDVNTGDGSVTVTAAAGSKMAGPWRIHTEIGRAHV